MKLSFLFGSGISKASGLQTVQQMTDALFTEPYFEHTSQKIIKGVHPSEYLRQIYDVKPLQDFLELIREKSNAYLTTKLGPQHLTTYEDLYYIVDQIYQESRGSSDNLAITPFIQELNNLSSSTLLRYKKGTGYPPNSIDVFCNRSRVLIETVVKYGLWDKDPMGLDLLVKLAKNDKTNSLEIFTLNHDTLIEKLFENEKEITLCDGFGSPDGEIRWYGPSLYDKISNVNIYHLHGARNWSWVRRQENDQDIDEYAILTGSDNWHSKRADGTMVTLLFEDGNLLTGANKSQQYLFGIFGELFYRFFTMLRSTDRLVVSGYGWNDYAINRKLLEWFRLNEHAKLLLIHKDPEDLIHHSRYLTNSMFDELKNSKKFLVLEKWFEEVTFDEIMSFA